MYFPVGWPRALSLPQADQCFIRQVICNRGRTLFAILTDDSLSIWFCKPCVPIVSHRRSGKSLQEVGCNEFVEWRQNSSMLAVATSGGHLLIYGLIVKQDQKRLYEQRDSPIASLKRDSAELFLQETIPALLLNLEEDVNIGAGPLTSITCLREELMVATTGGFILRVRWDGTQNRDYSLDLRRIPFCVDQQVSKAVPIVEANTHVASMEFSPLMGGFAIVFNDGRAAFLTASTIMFDPNQTQGIWAQGIEDATCASVNHKYRLIAFGRKNSQAVVYCVDESTGGLIVSHEMVLSPKDFPGFPGQVQAIRWTPDCRCVALAWANGGFSLWSTFGALLACSLGWDFGDSCSSSYLNIKCMEWSAEGYQLWMVRRPPERDPGSEDGLDRPVDTILILDCVKSALTVNPCMSHLSHLYLQGEDRLYINLGGGRHEEDKTRLQCHGLLPGDPARQSSPSQHQQLVGSKQWVVILLPSHYSAANWPIRFTALDEAGEHLAVAGQAGLALYAMGTRRWKLFGSESQEQDTVVSGGLLWWRDHVVVACYTVSTNSDQLRLYPRDAKLDNSSATIVPVARQALLINLLRDNLVTFCVGATVTIYSLALRTATVLGTSVSVTVLQVIDMSVFGVHPTHVVSLALTAMRTETGRSHHLQQSESVVLNVSGRLLTVQRGSVKTNGTQLQCAPPTVLASCVEHVWVPTKSRRDKPHLTEALWIFCGVHGMRVWLPLFPKAKDPGHTFMSKRIMLPFQLRIYPLAILFEDAILLGAENDTMLYSSDAKSPFSSPFCVLERTSQVYLHQILRQLIRRNLGYHAWEIARSCTALPYFPHSLELLLHEVLEEEATSKEPIPDALLPSVVEFIQEFPVYLQTVAHCARKTEIALWPYLFSAAGKPKDLFQECLSRNQLDTAASYLIILQNLEPSVISRQYATLLLDAALDRCQWDLSKDLVRFLKAIDPNDVESPRASFVMPASTIRYGMNPQSPPLSPTQEDLSLVLGTMQLSRGRSFSTTVQPKLESGSLSTASISGSQHRDLPPKPNVVSDGVLSMRRKQSVPTGRADTREPARSAEEFFIDVILQRHARNLLCARRLADLGRMAARLDFQLVAWLARERDRAARLDDPVAALQQMHEDFCWPHPAVAFPFMKYLDRKVSSTLTEEGVQSLSMDTTRGAPSSRVGDSGYMSQSGLQGSKLHEEFIDFPGLHNVQEAHLLPHNLGDDRSILSQESSFWGEDRERSNHFSVDDPGSTWSSQTSADVSLSLDQLVIESSCKGTPRSEVQLRYLLQVVTEAGCLEWALVLAVLLRDAMAVVRTAAAARAPSQSYAAVLRLLNIINTLAAWSSTQCLGYKPFMVTVQEQVSVLSSLLSSKQQQQQQLIQQQQQEQLQHLTQFGGRIRTTSCNIDNSNQNVTNEISPGKAERIMVSSDSTGSNPASEVTLKASSVRSDTVEVATEINEEQPSPLQAQPEAESGCSVS